MDDAQVLKELTLFEQKTRVTHINVGRVYNLGNYENLRVELSVDIAPSDDPTKVFRSIENILRDLRAKSGVDRYDLHRAKEALAKPESELDEYEQKKLKSYREYVAKHEASLARRQKAREALATLDYTSEHKDHKLDWDDDGFGDY